MVDSIGVSFQIHLCIPECVMSCEFTRTFSFLKFGINVYLPSNFVHSKPFQSVRDRLKNFNCSQKSIVYYAGWNADLNLILNVGMVVYFSNNQFTYYGNTGIRLTWRNCIHVHFTCTSAATLLTIVQPLTYMP